MGKKVVFDDRQVAVGLQPTPGSIENTKSPLP